MYESGDLFCRRVKAAMLPVMPNVPLKFVRPGNSSSTNLACWLLGLIVSGVASATFTPPASKRLMSRVVGVVLGLNSATPVSKFPVISTGSVEVVVVGECPTPASVMKAGPGPNKVKMAPTPTGTFDETSAEPTDKAPELSVCMKADPPAGTFTEKVAALFTTPAIVTGNGVLSGFLSVKFTVAAVLETLTTMKVVRIVNPVLGSRPFATWARLKVVRVSALDTTGSVVLESGASFWRKVTPAIGWVAEISIVPRKLVMFGNRPVAPETNLVTWFPAGNGSVFGFPVVATWVPFDSKSVYVTVVSVLLKLKRVTPVLKDPVKSTGMTNRSRAAELATPASVKGFWFTS